MTDILSQVTESKSDEKLFILPFGPGGVGKSTIGASAPNPIFIRTEKGTSYLRDKYGKKIKHVPDPKTFSDIIVAVDALLTKPHNYETLVIDSLDWAEPMCWAEVCKEMGIKSIGDAAYGKGYDAAQQKWKVLIDKLKVLREKMHIILIAHSSIRKAQDPINATEYDRYEIKLRDKTAALIKEAVDAVLFCTYEVFTKKEGMKTRAFGDGARVMLTQYRPSHDGKNRMGLPYQLELSWESLIEAIESDKGNTAEILKQELSGMVSALTDLTLQGTVREAIVKAGDNVSQLEKIKNRLRIKLEV